MNLHEAEQEEGEESKRRVEKGGSELELEMRKEGGEEDYKEKGKGVGQTDQRSIREEGLRRVVANNRRKVSD